MIDEKKLIEDILYSDKWNNAPCPMWVIRMIVANSKEDTPVEIRTHLKPTHPTSFVIGDSTYLTVTDAIRYISELMDSPCYYMRGAIDIGDEMKFRYPDWCNHTCKNHSIMECWQKYFEMRKEEEGKWEK